MRAGCGGDPKDQTKPLNCHLATQITKKKPQHPVRRKRPRPPPALQAYCVTRRNHNIDHAVKCLSHQSSDEKEGRRVTREKRGNQCCPKQVRTDTEAVVVACHQNQCCQNFNAPLLPSGQYCSHGVAIFAWSSAATPPFQVWRHIRRNPFEIKKKQKQSIFIYCTTFKKNESGRDFQQGQICNDLSQKQIRITAVTQYGIIFELWVHFLDLVMYSRYILHV
jgi:hypothetical protein